jgi:glucosylceramidase
MSKNSFVYLQLCWLLPLAVGCQTARATTSVLHWKCSTPAAPWVDEPVVDESTAAAQPDAEVVSVNPDQHFQTIDGWGGCFNERGWRAMQVLSNQDRTAVMRKMFDPTDGLKLNICRTPIAASDYAISLYSYDETPGDYDMAHFSIDRDRQLLIPYIKAALAIQPDLKLWAVPWSPPSWMKDSGKLTGGHILTDAQTMDALALYFAKYVQAYQSEGLPLYMVMPQNEPCYSTGYTSCKWNGNEMAIFVRNHLGPLFKQLNLKCQIYLGTFPRSDAKKFDYDYWLASAMDDPLTRSYVTGVGCQWGGANVMRDARDKNPGLKLMQTEAECGKTNTNDWVFAQNRFAQVVTYLNSGAESFMIWNLVLDETGLSTARWAQCSPIVVNQSTHEVTYTPYFYAFEHFSSFVKPGSVRVEVASGKRPCEAFVTPDGRVVVVAENTAPTTAAVVLVIAGHRFPTNLPADSFNTFVLDPVSRQPTTPTR